MSVDYTYSALKDYILQEMELPNGVLHWVDQYRMDVSWLNRLFQSVNWLENMLYDRRRGVTYLMEENVWEVTSASYHFMIKKTVFLRLIQTVCDMLTPVLPLGSVVDLKKEMLPDPFRKFVTTRFRVVIVRRFLTAKDENIFFPYSGIVYPIGSRSKEVTFHFYPEMIDRIVHRGFKDAQDSSYAGITKKRLVIEKGLKSASFASEEELARLTASLFL